MKVSLDLFNYLCYIKEKGGNNMCILYGFLTIFTFGVLGALLKADSNIIAVLLVLFFLFLIWMMFFDAKTEVSSSSGRKQIKQRYERQKEYEKEYGIITSEDKDD